MFDSYEDGEGGVDGGGADAGAGDAAVDEGSASLDAEVDGGGEAEPARLLDDESAAAIEGVDPLTGMSMADVLKDAAPPVKALVAGLNKAFTQKTQEIAVLRRELQAELEDIRFERSQLESRMFGDIADPGEEPEWNPMDPTSVKEWNKWQLARNRFDQSEGVRSRMSAEKAQRESMTALHSQLLEAIPELSNDSHPIHDLLEAELAKMPQDLDTRSRALFIENAAFKAQRRAGSVVTQKATDAQASAKAAANKSAQAEAIRRVGSGAAQPGGKPTMPKGLSLSQRVAWIAKHER